MTSALTLLSIGSEDQRKEYKERIEKLSREAQAKLLEAGLRMYELKHPAFKEEREWRLITINLVTRNSEPFYRYLSFRACSDRLVPHRVTPLPDLGIPIFNKIVLGPKHATPISFIEVFLAKFGQRDIEIERSAATYR